MQLLPPTISAPEPPGVASYLYYLTRVSPLRRTPSTSSARRYMPDPSVAAESVVTSIVAGARSGLLYGKTTYLSTYLISMTNVQRPLGLVVGGQAVAAQLEAVSPAAGT